MEGGVHIYKTNKDMQIILRTERQLFSTEVILTFIVPCIRPRKEVVKWIRIKTVFYHLKPI